MPSGTRRCAPVKVLLRCTPCGSRVVVEPSGCLEGFCCLRLRRRPVSACAGDDASAATVPALSEDALCAAPELLVVPASVLTPAAANDGGETVDGTVLDRSTAFGVASLALKGADGVAAATGVRCVESVLRVPTELERPKDVKLLGVLMEVRIIWVSSSSSGRSEDKPPVGFNAKLPPTWRMSCKATEESNKRTINNRTEDLTGYQAEHRWDPAARFARNTDRVYRHTTAPRQFRTYLLATGRALRLLQLLPLILRAVVSSCCLGCFCSIWLFVRTLRQQQIRIDGIACGTNSIQLAYDTHLGSGAKKTRSK